MGNGFSGHKDKHIFEKELAHLNAIIHNILTEDDIFKNKDYNFLSQNICSHYQVVLESELSKHLKMDVKELGTALYLIPKNNTRISKQQICDKIINHYIKILYILCLVKYVYNLEERGDLSIAGIIFRNIKITHDLMEIYFCGLPHKNYTDGSSHKIDFGKLAGMKFFLEYFLTPEESRVFTGTLQAILARSTPSKVQGAMCHDRDALKALESLYAEKFKGKKLVCQKGAAGPALNMTVFVQKDNPILLADYCGAPMKIVLKLNTVEGKKIYQHYLQMKKHFGTHLDNIKNIIDKIVDTKHELRDISKEKLNEIIADVKTCTKLFYLQSIVDFQNLLDMAKDTPNIHIA